MDEIIKMPVTRSSAREYVFALLFARTFAPEDAADEFYSNELENAQIEFDDQIDYVHGVFFGVEDKLTDIDGLISEAANGWNLSRLSKTTLAIMRLSVYEMMSVSDVPKRVSLNEAVELAKKYDDDNAPAYINGVLNAISKKLPDRECDAN